MREVRRDGPRHGPVPDGGRMKLDKPTQIMWDALWFLFVLLLLLVVA